MGPHDAWVQRSEVESGNWLLVKPDYRIQNIGPFIPNLCGRTIYPFVGHNETFRFSLPEQLADNLNLLTPFEQEVNGDSSDSSHFTMVVETAQFLHQLEG